MRRGDRRGWEVKRGVNEGIGWMNEGWRRVVRVVQEIVTARVVCAVIFGYLADK